MEKKRNQTFTFLFLSESIGVYVLCIFFTGLGTTNFIILTDYNYDKLIDYEIIYVNKFLLYDGIFYLYFCDNIVITTSCY